MRLAPFRLSGYSELSAHAQLQSTVAMTLGVQPAVGGATWQELAAAMTLDSVVAQTLSRATWQELAASLSLSSDVSLSNNDGTALGRANYSLYFDANDHDFVHGQTLSNPITPRVGAFQLTPTLSPTYVATGIGGRGAIDFGTTINAYLDGAGYAALADGSDPVISGAIKFQRVGNESGKLLGWGRGSTTDQYFEIGYVTSGLVSIEKDGTSETTKVRTSATAQLGFTEHVLGFSMTGTTVTVYLDGVAIPDLTNVDLDTTTAAITNFRIGTTGRSTGGTDDAAAKIQVVEIKVGVVWSAAQHARIYAHHLAENLPAPVGTPIAAIGNSHTKASAQHGWRGYKNDRFVARGQVFDFQGHAADGDFADNQHSGVNGTTLAEIAARATAQYGTGKPYPNVKLVYACMLATNNFSDVNGYVDTATTIAAWTSCITAIDTAITSTNPTARIVVSTDPNFDPLASTYARQQAFNAALPAAIASWNAAHPTRKLFFADVAARVGAYDPARYLNEVHYNNAGNQLAGAAIDEAVDADGNTVLAYEASIAA